MLTKEVSRESRLYSVGYSPSLDMYILATTMVGIWRYRRYFTISKTNYDDVRRRRTLDEFDMFAWRCRKEGNLSSVFLCSEKEEENNSAQQELYSKLSEGFEKYDYDRIIRI